MYISSCALPDRRKIPVLFHDKSHLPVLVPFLYVTLKRQYKAFNTIRNDLVAIRAFYQFHSIYRRDIEELLIAGRFSTVLASMEQFAAWISAARVATNVVGRIGKATDETGVAPVTRDTYLRSLKKFLMWCVQRYPNDETSADRIGESLKEVAAAIEMRFDSFLLQPATREVRERSLSDSEIEIIRTLSHPQSLLNPFRKKNRRRNWLMLEVLIETGVRLGELLILTTFDVVGGYDRCYLTVIIHDDAGTDTRATPPSLKNTHSKRTIAISPRLFSALQDYIRYARRPFRNGQPLKLSHGYLWVSERGSPMAANSTSSMVERLVMAARKTQPTLFCNATPHSFRYTFAERFLSYLVDVKNFDMERAKDELRTICGWSEGSDMPQHYAQRYIHNMANEHNVKRVEAAWNRLQMASPCGVEQAT